MAFLERRAVTVLGAGHYRLEQAAVDPERSVEQMTSTAAWASVGG
jgi:hypothetical protein